MSVVNGSVACDRTAADRCAGILKPRNGSDAVARTAVAWTNYIRQ